jgi:outer membrane receptor protein involved in Fe transport
VVRSALFVQDEWDIGAAWSAYLGLRREDLRTRGGGSAHATVDVRAGAWSPIAQLLFKPAGQDGLRFAASRTYKAPNIAQLMPRRYTVDNANSAANPDQQGNPNLRPELAFGIDLAWERTGAGNDLTSVSLFHKRIHDITLDRLYQSRDVWIVTPDNRGEATVQGVEFDAKRTRGALSARVNLARNWSRVDAVPGPDSHIAGQAAWSGNLGLDLAVPGTLGALDLGGTWSYRGRVATRTSEVLLERQDVRRQLDLYAVWKRDSKGKLRLSVTDLLHGDGVERSVYLGGPGGAGRLVRTAAVRNYPGWRLVWEQSL